MAQCDVFHNEAESKSYAPYLLDVQADLLRDLDTRVIIPLVKAAAFGKPIRNLHPQFEIDGEPLVMATHLVAAIAKNELRRRETNFAEHRHTIIAAIDIILSGI